MLERHRLVLRQMPFHQRNAARSPKGATSLGTIRRRLRSAASASSAEGHTVPSQEPLRTTIAQLRKIFTELLPMMFFGRPLPQKSSGHLYPLVIGLVVRRLGHLGLRQRLGLVDGALPLLSFLLGLLAFGER